MRSCEILSGKHYEHLRELIQFCLKISLIAFSIPALAIVNLRFIDERSWQGCQDTLISADPYSISAYYQQQANYIAPDRWAYRGRTPDFDLGMEFYASNEFDWFQSPVQLEPADVVIGFGTNSAWKIAYERGAKRLIISDWNPQVLTMQEFFVRPLLLEASCPAEFFSFVAGVPLTSKLENRPLNQVFKYLMKEKKLTSVQAVRRRMDFVNVLAERLAKRGDLTPMHVDFVRRFLRDLIWLQSEGGIPRS